MHVRHAWSHASGLTLFCPLSYAKLTRHAPSADSEGSFSCACLLGYARDGASDVCSNVDECLANLTSPQHNCGAYTTCMDTNGSFVCACNQSGLVLQGAAECVDVNECVNGTHNCSQLATVRRTAIWSRIH